MKMPGHDRWMQPLEPVPGVRVLHRIDRKLWRIETPQGVLVVMLNWRAGEMRACWKKQASPSVTAHWIRCSGLTIGVLVDSSTGLIVDAPELIHQFIGPARASSTGSSISKSAIPT